MSINYRLRLVTWTFYNVPTIDIDIKPYQELLAEIRDIFKILSTLPCQKNEGFVYKKKIHIFTKKENDNNWTKTPPKCDLCPTYPITHSPK